MHAAFAKKILLIDDEPSIAETIAAYAQKENMDVLYAKSGEEGLEIFRKNHFDLILLDWMLPGISGPEIIKYIREKSAVPILMLSARSDETDIVIGLEMGADDYITKPFGPRELIARIYALLRRSKKEVIKNSEVICDNLKIFFERKEVYKDNKLLKLTPNEFRILEELYKQRERVVSREELMNILGYYNFMNDRTLDTHIKNIRRKIEEDPKNPQIIKTVRETGFKFCISSQI